MQPPKVTTAHENDGQVTAVVSFDDGLTQTVVLPAWATAQNIKDEAKRLRAIAEARESGKVDRKDLVDQKK